MSGARAVASLMLVAVLAGCSSVSYYWQAVAGHVDLMQRRRDITSVLADPATPAPLRVQLERVQAMRRFASQQLALPDNGSYRSYADLGRPFVIWNVFATPELSNRPRDWCFPIAGCVAYRGYFNESDARAEARALQGQGFDTFVGGVPAYSTLGWMDDPVLSTFVRWPEVEVARLLFHELAHQVAYAPGDTAFNEAFASAVEDVGVERWIAQSPDPTLAAAWTAARQHREDFLRLVLSAREALDAVYAGAQTDADKRREKASQLTQLQLDYLALKQRWGGYAGYDRWFSLQPNNAQLASVAVYSAQVPAFLALLHAEGDELPRFYQRVRTLAKLSPAARRQALDALAPSAAIHLPDRASDQS